MCQPYDIVTISCLIFKAIPFHLVSHRISFFFIWSTKNWCQPHFLVSNKIQNIKQHHLETKTRLIFDYALLFAAYCRPGITPWINNKFWSIISFYLFKSICLYFLWDKFHTYYLTSFSVGCCGKCLWLGFLNLCMAVTTDDNISNLVKEGIMTIHIGFLNFSLAVTSVWW